MAQPIVPPATIGMVGGGQLGRYALMAASAMGYRTVVLDPDPSAPAGVHANDHLIAPYDDAPSLDRLLRECDVITTEFENPPAEVMERLAATTRVAPRPASVAIAQDRIAEKTFLVDNGFPVGPFAVLEAGRDTVLDAVLDTVPDAALATAFDGGAIVKTARLGYDGKGQRSVDSVAGAHAAVAELGGVRCIVESRLALRAELSVIVARTADARVELWPVAENRHVDGVLDVSIVPARVDPLLADRAIGLAMAIADALDYVGVLAVELFVVADVDAVGGTGSGGAVAETLLVNELAPRPHNSGHWTLDASVTSQFEQQIRAVCGVGLGATSMTAPAVAMANLLGDLWLPDGIDGRVREPRWQAIFDDPHATLHLYGKSQPRPGRKMGHVTVTADTPDQAERRVVELRDALLAD